MGGKKFDSEFDTFGTSEPSQYVAPQRVTPVLSTLRCIFTLAVYASGIAEFFRNFFLHCFVMAITVADGYGKKNLMRVLTVIELNTLPKLPR